LSCDPCAPSHHRHVRIGQIKEYYTDAWNILDLAGCANVFVVVAVCGGNFPNAQQSTAFRVIAALGCLSVWLKVGKCCF